MNTYQHTRLHREAIEKLYTIRDFEDRNKKLQELIASCDEDDNKYHPYFKQLKESYTRSGEINQQRIDDEWREYYALLKKINPSPVREFVNKASDFLFPIGKQVVKNYMESRRIKLKLQQQ